jgi:hypothetical protein
VLARRLNGPFLEGIRMSDAILNALDSSHAPPKSTLRRRLFWITLIAVLCGLAVWFVNAAQSAREAARSLSCQGQLKQLGLALLNYHQANGCLPPAYLLDKNGKPAHSWRMFLVRSWPEVDIPSYDFSESWNSPRNSELSLRHSCFACPSARDRDSPITDYVVVVGPNTLWPGSKGATLAKDGSDDDKILLIEIVKSDIHWTEPRDLTLEEALDVIQPKTGIGIGSLHPRGIHYVTANDTVRTLDRNIDRNSLRKLLTRESVKNPVTGGRTD